MPQQRRLLLLLALLLITDVAAASSKGPASSSKPLLSPSTIRRTVLCTLAVQNACQMLSMRYSRLPSQPAYLSSTAVVMAEVVKILLSILMLFVQVGPQAGDMLWQNVILNWRDTLQVGIPAVLYLIQNNLLYVAASHLDAATCQVAYQLKLLTTAFFSVTLLHRHISTRRWASLGLLFVGVVLVQYPSSAKAAAAAHGTVQSPLLGMAAVSGACLLSGLAGVWLERIVKRTADVPVWVRNVQLGLVSLIIGLGSVWSLDGHAIRAAGFFQGYTWVVVSVVLQVSAGGLLVGLIMRYADNVIKGFATSLSIILSSVLSSFIPAFDFAPSPTFIAGSTLVILATILYSSQQEAGGSSTSSSAAQFEKGSAGMFERAAKAHDWRPIRDDFASSAHARNLNGAKLSVDTV